MLYLFKTYTFFISLLKERVSKKKTQGEKRRVATFVAYSHYALKNHLKLGK